MQGRSVLLVEKEVGLRNSLGRCLESFGATVQEFDSGEALLNGVTHEADALVATIRLGGIGALGLHRELDRRRFHLPIIVTTAHEDVSEALRAVHAMKEGAADLIEKPVDEIELVECLRRKFHRVPEKAEKWDCDQATAIVGQLTLREREVLVRLAKGLTHRRIGEELGISHRTVEVYAARILLKTRERSLAGLIQLAVLAGMVG